MSTTPELNATTQGDVLPVLQSWPANFVQTVVTSPPYWALRDYGVKGQLGLERTPGRYVGKMVRIFDEVKRVLKPDGTLWLNMGDTYNSGPPGARDKARWPKQSRNDHRARRAGKYNRKPKDLIGIPWLVAFALQRAGWTLRADIIWAKPNPMPESVKDRPTKSHEYIFLLTKSARYFYDDEAIREPAILSKGEKMPSGWNAGPGDHRDLAGRYSNGKHATQDKQSRGHRLVENVAKARAAGCHDDSPFGAWRNKRSVWNVNPIPFKEAHFATFPEDLIAPCIKAGSRQGDIVLDPFMGAGTTAVVAKRFKRNWLGIELNEKYIEIAQRRISLEPEPLLVE